jgi:uncharacterized protein involved in cysteine biosynthesis
VLGRLGLSLFTKRKDYALALVIGVVILQALLIIPCFGVIVGIVVFLVGLGAMLRMQYEKYTLANKSRKKK